MSVNQQVLVHDGHSDAASSTTPRNSVKQFAERWGVSEMTIYRALRDGQIAGATKVRSQWRIPADATFTA